MGSLIADFKLGVSYRHLMTAGGKRFNRKPVPTGQTTEPVKPFKS